MCMFTQAGGGLKTEKPGEVCDSSKRFPISKAVLQSADRCMFSKRCTSTPEGVCCPVVRWLSDKYLFVEKNSEKICPYSMVFGLNARVCACPVRNALFRQYAV